MDTPEPNPITPTVKGVVFDWYATLARPFEEEGWWGQVRRLITDAGGTVNESAVVAWQTMPTDHRDHSVSRDSYQSWSIGRFRSLLAECGVPEHRLDAAGRESERIRNAEVVPAIEGVRATLAVLRDAGLVVALRSNWDWDLERHLVANGLEDAFDFVVCSAIAGYRKPNPAIFDLVLRGISLDPASVLFVGDDLEADVGGALGSGLTPIHAAWALPCAGGHAPEVHCCTSLSELLELPLLADAVATSRSTGG